MGDQYHEDDEMKVVYHGEMEAGNTTENLFVSVWGYVTLGSKNFKSVAFLLRRSWVRPSRAEDVPACGLHGSNNSQARRNPLGHRIGLGFLPVCRMDFFAAQSDKVWTATPRWGVKRLIIIHMALFRDWFCSLSCNMLACATIPNPEGLLAVYCMIQLLVTLYLSRTPCRLTGEIEQEICSLRVAAPSPEEGKTPFFSLFGGWVWLHIG